MILFQLSKADGSPDWGVGCQLFSDAWVRARDHLRFHRGAGYVIKEGHGTEGPKRTLDTVDDHLAPRLDKAPADTVFRIRSLKDSYTILIRRHEVIEDKGQLVVQAAAQRENTPYLFGVTDCSWLSLTVVQQVSGIVLPHNAHAQRLDPRVKAITDAQLEPGDLVFIHNDDHVAVWVGKLEGYPGNVVWDTEPHSTVSPVGWPTPELGTGVQVRPAYGNYYCAAINARGRIPEINGSP